MHAKRDHLALHGARGLRSHDVGRDRGVDLSGPQHGLVAHDDDLRRVMIADRPHRALRAALLLVGRRDGDQRHDAVARVRELFGFLLLREREFRPDVGERGQHLAHRDALTTPFGARLGLDQRAHGRCHSLPSCSRSLSAAGGPHVPDGIHRERRAVVPPRRLDRVDERPRGLDLVRAREECRVADHAVEQQALVGLRRLDQERGHVLEVHRHAADPQAGARHLRSETQRDALFGLDAQRDRVRVELARGVGAEGHVGRALELDADLRHALGHPLALRGCRTARSPSANCRCEA